MQRYQLPFFDDGHRQLAQRLAAWITEHPDFRVVEAEDGNAATRSAVKALGEAGFLAHAVPHPDAAMKRLDSRSIALIRELLSYHSVLADCGFAIQGIGSAPISLFGSDEMRRRYLPGFRDGSRIAALALSEPQGGSDVANMVSTAVRDGDAYVLNGEKTWISNGGIADLYVVVARTGEAPGAHGLTAFAVDADAPGLAVEPFAVNNNHPIASLRFSDCRIAASQRIGESGSGFRVAMANLDIFRPTVGACALGIARRALDEAVGHARSRRVFGKLLQEIDSVQAKLADMSVDLELATLAVYRAVWAADRLEGKQSRLAATAKLAATEMAQRVVDAAVQLFGGLGVKRGMIVERLYRDVRALRIGEGASEIQKLVIARGLLKDPGG